MMPSRNGIAQDPQKDREWRERSALKYAEKQRAKIETRIEGQRTVVRRTPIKPVSDRRSAQLADYRPLRDAYLTAHPHCVRCGQVASEVHHKAGRTGTRLLDQTDWAAVCRPCHLHITGHPREAIEQGYSLPRIGRAA